MVTLQTGVEPRRSVPGGERNVKGNPAGGGWGVMRLLGVDYGEATIGLALSDELGMIAQGLMALRRRRSPADLEAIADLARQREVGAIVVGLPKNMDGSIGPSARAAEAFARDLADRTGLPIHLWDERLTTRQVERVMIAAGVRRAKRRAVLDVGAATLILQGFLDHLAMEASEGGPGPAPAPSSGGDG